jgi:hypothetical protein
MDTNKKNVVQQAGQWLRVGTLTLTVLGPIINAVSARLRERESVVEPASTTSSPIEKLQAASTTLTEALLELKEHPYSRQLLKRGEDLTEELRERGNEFSRQLAKRGKYVSRELKRRSRTTRRELAEQSNAFWITFGFAVGLTAATIVAYLLVRKRMRRIDEETEIELSWNESLYQAIPRTTTEARPVSAASPIMLVRETETLAPTVAVAEQAKEQTGFAIPANATFVGVVNTKRYYPIETPLDQLASASASDGSTHIIYFTSEEEARSQGFTRAV